MAKKRRGRGLSAAGFRFDGAPAELQPESIFAAIQAMAIEQAIGRGISNRHQAKLQAAVRKWRRKRKAIAAEAAAARLAASRARRRRRRVYGQRMRDRMLAVMVPGEWYGRLDIVRRAGLPRNANGKVLQELWVPGMVERTRNPAWRGAVDPFTAMAGGAEPEFLYRLTAAGELERNALLLLQ
jgi:hypothetical protein